MTPEEIRLLDLYGSSRDAKNLVPISRESIERMDNTIISNINDRVKESDVLYLLGDFCFCKLLSDVADLRNRIVCRNINLILGNHDSFQRSDYTKIFSFVSDYFSLKINGTKLVMSHYPMIAWDCSHYGSLMLHGHCHGNLENWKKGQENLSNKLIDVGVDNHSYKPWSFEELMDFSNDK